jgi:hypothetical protein
MWLDLYLLEFCYASSVVTFWRSTVTLSIVLHFAGNPSIFVQYSLTSKFWEVLFNDASLYYLVEKESSVSVVRNFCPLTTLLTLWKRCEVCLTTSMNNLNMIFMMSTCITLWRRNQVCDSWGIVCIDNLCYLLEKVVRQVCRSTWTTLTLQHVLPWW